MEFNIKIGNVDKQRHDCLIVSVTDNNKLSPAAKTIDSVSKGYLQAILKRGDLGSKTGAHLMLYHVPGTVCERVLLVNLGKERELTAAAYKQAVGSAIKALSGKNIVSVGLFLADASLKKFDLAWKVARIVEAAEDSTYRFEQMKSKNSDKKEVAKKLAKIDIFVSDKKSANLAEAGLKAGLAIASGVAFTKTLGNLPPNICHPTYLAEQAKAMTKSHGLSVEVLERKDMEVLGMGSFLGVAQGSVQPPKLIVMQHKKGKKSDKPIVLIGKGITFDTGGISLKPGAEMDEMKYDMCGAASVLGTMRAIAEMALPLNVIGIIPTCENMPDGNAIRPGDVLTSMSGQTIEVLNTDAEGRLILCDALTYAERFEPAAVIDIATLTGACVIALGHHLSGLFSNYDPLAKELQAAGENALDRAWHMPMLDDYQSQLDSNFADMANIGGRAAGSVTAACFLSRFAKKFHWAHLDIAGVAWKSGKEKGATGRPVPLLTTFLMARAEK